MVKMKSGSPRPNIFLKYLYRLLFKLKDKMIIKVEVHDEKNKYFFDCQNIREYSRCVKMFIKEPGTCEWIKSNLLPGQVFYDVGANIGVYTVLSAFITGENGRVYAFEPHSANFSRLLNHIKSNNLGGIVYPVNLALNNQSGIFPFFHDNLDSGASNSQLDAKGSKIQDPSRPRSCCSELKLALSIDDLIYTYSFDPPHHIKIDVDGNEMKIIHGMSKLLKSESKPITLQVEIHEETENDLMGLMREHGYVVSKTHFTRSKQKRHLKGENSNYPYNSIFKYDSQGKRLVGC